MKNPGERKPLRELSVKICPGSVEKQASRRCTPIEEMKKYSHLLQFMTDNWFYFPLYWCHCKPSENYIALLVASPNFRLSLATFLDTFSSMKSLFYSWRRLKPSCKANWKYFVLVYNTSVGIPKHAIYYTHSTSWLWEHSKQSKYYTFCF